MIDGRKQPVALHDNDGQLQTPLRPDEQSMQVSWRQQDRMSLRTMTPAVNIGRAVSNIKLNVSLPNDRWILFVGGPALGPAVLIWGLLLVVVLVASGLGRSDLTPLPSWQWLLLGLGLGLSTCPIIVLVVVWFFVLAARRRMKLPEKRWVFNVMQVALFGYSIVTLVSLVSAIPLSLLGHADMHITGNGSSACWLRWYQDRIAGPLLPQAWVISLPLWCYRVVMLVWSLWLAFALTGWLRWAWEGFSDRLLWRKAEEQTENRQ